MKYNLISFKKNNITLSLNKNAFNFKVSSFTNNRGVWLPFFSTGRLTTDLNKNVYYCYNKSLATSIYTSLRQNYFSQSNGYFIELLAIGVGYRFERLNQNNNILVINVGYSHYIYYLIATDVAFRCTKGYLFLFSTNLSNLKRTALEIKKYKVPNVYTGKGIKYLKEQITLKVGKKKK